MSFTAYTDGACRVANPGLCSAAFVVYDENGVEIFALGKFLGSPHSNNYAEYHGVIMALEWAKDNGHTGLEIWCDSELVVKQISGKWKLKHEPLRPLWLSCCCLLRSTTSTIQWIRGHNGNIGNEAADALCNSILNKVQNL